MSNMQFTRHTIAGHDLRLACHLTGDQPVAVMTNAFPQSIRCWESLWERLGAHLDLIAVDLAGFGLSSGSADAMRPSAQAELLLGVLETFEIERAFVIGPDIGVPVSLWLASEHPDRVAGLNIFDGPGTWPTDFDPALGAATRSRVVRWLGSLPPMRARLMRRNFNAATSAGYHHFTPSPEAIAEYRQICFDPEQHRNAFRYLGSYADELPIIEERLPSLAVPTLITWGAHDRFVRPSNATRLHSLLPNSELSVFEGAGHFSHEDADEEWLVRLLAFVDTHRHDKPLNKGNTT